MEDKVQIYREETDSLSAILARLSFGIFLLIVFLAAAIALWQRIPPIWLVLIIAAALGIAGPLIATAIYRLRQHVFMANLRAQHAREELEMLRDARRRANEQHTLQQHLAATRVAADPLTGNYPHLLMPPDTTHQVLSFAPGNTARGAGRVTKVEEVSDVPADAEGAIPTLVRYEDIRGQILPGQALVGVSARGVETKDGSVRACLWIVGGSGSGKSNTLALRVNDLAALRHQFLGIDPHAFKEDSMTNSVRGYASRFLLPIAQRLEDINDVLDTFLGEFSRRRDEGAPRDQPITILIDEVGSMVSDIDKNDELEQAVARKLKETARICGQEARGFNMGGIFISQDAAGLAWLRKRALMILAHQVTMWSERLLVCNNDAKIARAMDTWPKGRTLAYGIAFEQGAMVVQQPLFTARPMIEAGTMPALPVREQRAFTQGHSDVNAFTESVNALETPAEQPAFTLIRGGVNVSEDSDAGAQKNVDTSKVSNEIRRTIVRMEARATRLARSPKPLAWTVDITRCSKPFVWNWASGKRRKRSMATVQQQPTGRYHWPSWSEFLDGIIRLDKLSSVFSWLFMLAARLAEPVMLLSVMYVIAEAGVPSLSSTLLQDIAVAALITAPEIILPGSFVVAAQAKAAGDKKATLLYVMCWAFVALTTVTLAALFVLHPAPAVMSIIMCARCAVGVGYSILIRVMFATDRVYQAQGASAPAIDIAAALADLDARNEQRIAALAESLKPAPVDTVAIIEETTRRTAERLETMLARMTERVTCVVVEQVTAQLLPAPVPVVESRTARLSQFRSPARDMEVRERIRALLAEQPDISSRKAGELAGCSHTTAASILKELRNEPAA
jgi:hypothetical protein